MNARVAGIVLLLGIIAGGLVYWWFFQGGGASSALQSAAEVRGLIGSEKNNLLQSPKLIELMARKHGLRWSFTREGSVEQVRAERIALAEKDGPVDYLWPSSQVSLELFRAWNPNRRHHAEVIFNTPIVLFTWDVVAKALQDRGLVESRDGVLYLTGFTTLIDRVLTGTSWKDLGLPQLFGKVNVIPTDPTRSNSGNLFAGLLANLLAGDVAREADLPQILPKIVQYFERQGFMEHSTGFLFEQFLSRGMGSYPIIVGYENQLVEFALSNPELWKNVHARLKIVYPVPTVWSSHTLIVLSDRGKTLAEAWKDPAVQELAWKEHGFRSVVPGVVNDANILGQVGIASSVDQVMPLPSGAVMLRITEALEQDR